MTQDNLKFLLYTTDASDAAFDVAERPTFYSAILNLLHSTSLYQQVFGSESIMNFIQSKADFPDFNFISKNDDDVYKLNISDFWNESVQTSWDNLLKYYKGENLFIEPWTSDDIKKADAAASYNFENNFVIAWQNIDKETYKYVRSTDIFKFILEKPTHSQYTHTQGKNWIRLIMPMNPRRVEVEDLNRNFWVIGQSLSIISSFLFSNDGFLQKMFKNVLREITEQWENMVYLWSDYTLLTGRSKSIQLILDLPNDKLHPYRKFDDFAEEIDPVLDPALAVTSQYRALKEDIVNKLNSRFSFLSQKYGKSTIQLWVRVRNNNYTKNYYSTEGYPYYGEYDGTAWHWYAVGFEDGEDSTKYSIYTSISSFYNEIYGMDSKGNYGKRSGIYNISALRIIPKFLNEKIGNSDKLAMQYEVYDAIELMINPDAQAIRVYKTKNVNNNLITMERIGTSSSTKTFSTGTLDPLNLRGKAIYPGETLTVNYQELMI